MNTTINEEILDHLAISYLMSESPKNITPREMIAQFIKVREAFREEYNLYQNSLPQDPDCFSC